MAEKDGRLAEAKARFKHASDLWDHNRKAWLEDAKFRALDQWPEAIKKKREQQGRPLLVVDKLNQYVRQVVNDGRQNRPGVKVRPIDDFGDEEVAEALQGMIRGICDRSKADEAFDTALDHAAGNGFGYFRVLTDYEHPKTFNQEIKVARVRNPLAILLGPHQNADGSDAEYGFVVDEIPKARFKKDYPKAKESDWESDAFADGWADNENVRIAEYWYKEDVSVTLHLLEDGTSIGDDEYQQAIAELGADIIPKIVETRQIPEPRVKWCRISGAEILEEREWLGKYIPIIPVYGNESDIEGKVTYSGLVRAAKDPQRLYNYSRSAYAERVALTSKAPWIAAEESIDNHPEWEDANEENYSVLKYRAYDEAGNPIPPPQKPSAADIPEGFARDMQLSEHDIQASMGMYAASLGQQSNEKSGKAIMARQREGDTATFHYMDNLNRAIRYLGLILVDLIPKVYDSKRVVRLLGEDGSQEEAQIDPQMPQAHQKIGARSIYNLNVGLYDVSVSAGPSYTTKRQEQTEAMTDLLQGNPQLMQIVGDLFVRAMDWPNAEQIADRLKLMLPPQILQAEQGQQQLPPEILQAQQQLQQQQEQMQQAAQQLQAMQQQIAQEQAATEADKAKLDAARQELQSEQKLLQSKYEELSAKLELQAMKLMTPVPQEMPPGKQEPAISPQDQPEPAQAGFFTPGA